MSVSDKLLAMLGTIRTAQPDPPTLALRLIGGGEQARDDDLMEQHHRRGALRRIGHELHYVATDSDGSWMALVERQSRLFRIRNNLD